MPTLSELQVSQPHAVALFTQAMATGRLHHAYMLVGVHRTSTQELACAVAQALVCSAGSGDACGTCAGCRKFLGGNHPDVLHLVPNDKDTIPIASIREACGRLQLKALEAPTKVIRIDGADRMNPAAQNALLKTLEEPPGATCFLLSASRPRRLLPTIRSRCQLVHLTPPRCVDNTLTAAGIDAALAPWLAPLVNGDVARAQAWSEGGAAHVLCTLGNVLRPDASALALLDAAAELGGDKLHSELALAFLELRLRDALATGHGGDATPLAGLASIAAPARPVATVAALQRLRKLSSLHINRTMALEGVFFLWAGKGDRGPDSPNPGGAPHNRAGL